MHSTHRRAQAVRIVLYRQASPESRRRTTAASAARGRVAPNKPVAAIPPSDSFESAQQRHSTRRRRVSSAARPKRRRRRCVPSSTHCAETRSGRRRRRRRRPQRSPRVQTSLSVSCACLSPHARTAPTLCNLRPHACVMPRCPFAADECSTRPRLSQACRRRRSGQGFARQQGTKPCSNLGPRALHRSRSVLCVWRRFG